MLNSFSEREAYEQRKNPVAEAREQNSRTRTQEEISREKAQVKAEKKRRKKKSKKNGCLFKMVWLVMIVLVSVVLAQYIMIGANDLLAVNRTEGTAEVSIPADCGYRHGSGYLGRSGCDQFGPVLQAVYEDH